MPYTTAPAVFLMISVEHSTLSVQSKQTFAFRLCAEKAYAIPGIIFDISNNYPEALAHIITQLQAVSGTYKTVYHKPENDFHRALNSTALLRPTLARSLLGWEPRKPPLAEGMKVYYHAWLASTA